MTGMKIVLCLRAVCASEAADQRGSAGTGAEEIHLVWTEGKVETGCSLRSVTDIRRQTQGSKS